MGSAIAYNVWQYFQVTHDVEFLQFYGAELILDIARFWSSIASFNDERGRYEIRGVMGPDEFHEGYPNSPTRGLNNNAYTMAVWVLCRALEVLDLLPDIRRAELMTRLGLSAEEIARWDHISRRMCLPFHGDGIISQFEGYEKLIELDWENYRIRYGNIQRLDLILEAENDSANRYKLQRANIGVSMGSMATEVARAAAGLVLLNDDFGALVATISDGQRLFFNIQKAFRYLIGFKVLLVAMAFGAPLFDMPILLTPLNVVWLELIAHTVSALVFEGRGSGEDVMGRPPLGPSRSIVLLGAALRSSICGGLLTIGALGAFAYYLPDGEPYARSAAMVTAVIGSVLLIFSLNSRASYRGGEL